MKPDLKYYPIWLRKEIFPDIYDLEKPILFDMHKNEESLKRIYETYRLSPLNRIVFMLVIKSIRNEFDIYSMQKKIEYLEKEIEDMKGVN